VSDIGPYRIDVFYESCPDEGLDKEITHAMGREPWGSGYDFGSGTRDLSFCFDSVVDRDAAQQRLTYSDIAIGGGISWRPTDEEEDEEENSLPSYAEILEIRHEKREW
jgi:hypothetical protein